MMTRQEAFVFGKQKLKQGNIPDWQWEAEVLLEYVLNCNRTGLLLDGNKEIALEQEKQYKDFIEERLNHVPLQYLTGEQEFMGLSFKVSPSVLIPRQDTEILVEQVLERLKKITKPGSIRQSEKLGQWDSEKSEIPEILDMCTGSGCIAISLERLGKNYVGQYPKVTAVDISTEALEIARENAKENDSAVVFLESDLFSKVEGQFDVIVSNPPYIASHEVDTLMEEVRLFEPRLALDGMEDGLFFYDKIIKEAPKFLKENGWLFFEIGYDQGQSVPKLMEQTGYVDIGVKKDLAGLDRVVYGRICHV